MANGIDNGDSSEGANMSAISNEQDPSHTSTFQQGSISTEKEGFQKNISPNVGGGGFLGYGVSFTGFNATYNPTLCAGTGNRFYDSIDMNLSFASPDIAAGTGGEVVFYNPPGNDISCSFAQSFQCDVTAGSPSVIRINPAVDPASDNYSTNPYNMGLVGLGSGTDVTVNFVRLLPKGTYAITFNNIGFSPSLSGFSADFYWSTIAGDNLIASVDDAGNASTGNTTTFTITTPWAWIKLTLHSISYFQCNEYGVFFAINSYTP